MTDQLGTVAATRPAVHPLRQLGLTVAALGELGAVLDPFRPLAATVLERGRARRAPGAAGEGAGVTARPSAPDPRPAERAVPVAERGLERTAQPPGRSFLQSLRRPVNIAFLAVLVVVLTAWWVELRPTSLLGGPATFITVKGTSMLPTLKTGDFVLAEAQPAYHVGDLVVYRVPKGQIGAGDDLIHRIVAGNATVGFTLKGDNNPAPDPWTVPRSDVLGKEAVVIPGFGSTLLVLRSPIFAGLAAALIAMWVVLSPPEWMRRRRPEPAAAAATETATPAPATVEVVPLRAAEAPATATATAPATAPARAPARRRPATATDRRPARAPTRARSRPPAGTTRREP
ncbi:MAG: signal peptidase I [Candidatus Dormibacteria bacterium]